MNRTFAWWFLWRNFSKALLKTHISKIPCLLIAQTYGVERAHILQRHATKMIYIFGDMKNALKQYRGIFSISPAHDVHILKIPPGRQISPSCPAQPVLLWFETSRPPWLSISIQAIHSTSVGSLRLWHESHKSWRVHHVDALHHHSESHHPSLRSSKQMQENTSSKDQTQIVKANVYNIQDITKRITNYEMINKIRKIMMRVLLPLFTLEWCVFETVPFEVI